MTHPTDSLQVAGSATFAGGSTTGKLTDGALAVGGDFSEAGTSVGDAFAPSGNHRTWLNGNTVQNVAFTHPGGTGATSRFMNLGITNPAPGAITVETDLYILGQSEFVGVPTQAVTGFGNVVHFANLFIEDPITFDNVLLSYDAALGGSDSISISNATFVNYDPNGTTPVISISHPGKLDLQGAPIVYQFSNITFSTTIGAGTGTYLSVTDTNTGNNAPFSINIQSNLAPAEGQSHTTSVPVPPAPGAPVITWSPLP
jgi:hypothetical protein